jgi:hypothetical protein
MSNQELKDIIEDWYILKKKLKDIEKKIDSNRNIIIDYMERNSIDKVITDNYIVKKKNMDREYIAKKDLPSDLWNKYSRKMNYNIYKININK